MTIMLALLAAIQATPLTPDAAPVRQQTVSREPLAIARRIVSKMGVDRQLRSVLKDVAPMFAGQVLLGLATSKQADSTLGRAAADPAKRQRITAMLTEEYIRAYEARLPALKEVVAATYVSHLSVQDLEAVDRFLDTTAGRNWAATIIAAQSEGAAAGARLGAEAGEAAYEASLLRLKDVKP